MRHKRRLADDQDLSTYEPGQNPEAVRSHHVDEDCNRQRIETQPEPSSQSYCPVARTTNNGNVAHFPREDYQHHDFSTGTRSGAGTPTWKAEQQSLREDSLKQDNSKRMKPRTPAYDSNRITSYYTTSSFPRYEAEGMRHQRDPMETGWGQDRLQWQEPPQQTSRRRHRDGTVSRKNERPPSPIVPSSSSGVGHQTSSVSFDDLTESNRCAGEALFALSVDAVVNRDNGTPGSGQRGTSSDCSRRTHYHDHQAYMNGQHRDGDDDEDDVSLEFSLVEFEEEDVIGPSTSFS